MTASNVELVLNIEGAELRMLHQQVLLCEAKPEDVEAGGAGGGPGDQGLADLEPPFFPFRSHISLLRPESVLWPMFLKLAVWLPRRDFQLGLVFPR